MRTNGIPANKSRLKSDEKLEHEDTVRMKHLGEDDSSAIYADLEAHTKDYPSLQTTF